MHAHPRLGADYLSLNKEWALPHEAILIVEQHHERGDGQGYPSRIRAHAITPRAALVAVADAYIAMREYRAYTVARSHSEALAELRACAGTQFHEAFVDAIHRLSPAIAEQAVALLPLSPCEATIREIAHAV